MSPLIVALANMYVSGKIDKKRIDEMLENGSIIKSEYKFILSQKQEV